MWVSAFIFIFAKNEIMALQTDIMTAMKAAMKEKDQTALAALRAIKSEILLAQTASGSQEGLTEADEIKLLSKLVKQRKDSATIFRTRANDLAEPELAQQKLLLNFFQHNYQRKKLSRSNSYYYPTGASGMKDMGKVMGVVNGKWQAKPMANHFYHCKAQLTA